MPRTIRSLRIARLVLAYFAVAAALRTAHAQTSDELAAARTLFSEALRDQDQKRFDVALEKFRRVLAVRDTVPVRYRIASCLEALGNIAQATVAYQAAVDIGQSEHSQDDVVRASRVRIEALARRVPRLSLSLSGRLPSEVDLRVDDRRVPSEKLKEALPLDPGEHVITASASGSKSFRTVVFLAEGGAAALTIPLDADPAAAAPVPMPRELPSEIPSPVRVRPREPSSGVAKTTITDSSAQRTAGIGLLAGGAALAVGGVVVYVMRANAIASLEQACPRGFCPTSRRMELDATRSRALALGPLAVGLGVAGVAALGIGSYLFVTAPTRNTHFTRVHVIPVFATGAAGLVLYGGF
jgi:tetratricopeptide (TPR) repeat protein